MYEKPMKQSKKVQIASESAVKVTTHRITDDLASVEIDDKMMTEEHMKMLEKAVHELLAENYHSIILDLTKLKRINSTGLGKFINLYKAAADKDGVMKIGGVSDFVRNVLTSTKLNEIFEIHNTLDDAIKSFQTSGA